MQKEFDFISSEIEFQNLTQSKSIQEIIPKVNKKKPNMFLSSKKKLKKNIQIDPDNPELILVDQNDLSIGFLFFN
jgi:hypothetical protein